MILHPPLSRQYIEDRLIVNVADGIAVWRDPSKYHPRLVGAMAGSSRLSRNGKRYWFIKLDGIAYLRSHLIYCCATGQWPTDQIDHRNGNSLDDRLLNLRAATQLQNARNHKGRAKKSPLPMGVRLAKSGRYEARIRANGVAHHLGIHHSPEAAAAVYQDARRQFFGEFA